MHYKHYIDVYVIKHRCYLITLLYNASFWLVYCVFNLMAMHCTCICTCRLSKNANSIISDTDFKKCDWLQLFFPRKWWLLTMVNVTSVNQISWLSTKLLQYWFYSFLRVMSTVSGVLQYWVQLPLGLDPDRNCVVSLFCRQNWQVAQQNCTAP